MKTFKKVGLTVAVLLGSLLLSFGQQVDQQLGHGQSLSYFELPRAINEFKWSACAPTADALPRIIRGLMDNYYYEKSEGFKRELVGNISPGKIEIMARTARCKQDGDFLRLLYITKQNLPPFLTYNGLEARVGKKGGPVKSVVKSFWKNKKIKDLVGCLEDYPPEDAARLVDIICQPWYKGVQCSYFEVYPSQASESLWDIYFDIRLVELAKRSLIVRLLGAEGMIGIPWATYAYFDCGRGVTFIPLDKVTICTEDIPELKRLLCNPYYGRLAGEYLEMLTR